MTTSFFDLTNHTALVTGVGSARGIGFAVARTLGSLGCSLVVTSQSSRCHERASDLRDLGLSATAVPADLTSELDIDELVRRAQQFGAVSIVVNNAGMNSVLQPMDTSGESDNLENVTQAAVEFAFARNVVSAMMLTKALLPSLRHAGRVVNITSVTGPVMAMKNEVAYATSKAAMVGFTRSLALDEARHGLTVNAVAPGWIATESQTEDERREGSTVPIGRSGTIDEVAAVVAFLCSPNAGYLTGQVIVVDGGNSIAEERSTVDAI